MASSLFLAPSFIIFFFSFSAGAKLPTMLTDQLLIVTISDCVTSVNNIKINGTPIYDDGVLLVYGIDRFFDPNFQNTGPGRKLISNSNSSCSALNFTVNLSGSFEQAVRTLKSGGYSVMASFLEVQFSSNINQNGITVHSHGRDGDEPHRWFQRLSFALSSTCGALQASMERSGGVWCRHAVASFRRRFASFRHAL
jgi:hypothetical protein